MRDSCRRHPWKPGRKRSRPSATRWRPRNGTSVSGRVNRSGPSSVLADSAPPRTPELGQNITLDAGATAPAVQPFQLARTPIAAEPESAAAGLVAGSERRGPAPPPNALFAVSDRDVVPPNLMGPPLPTKAPPGLTVRGLAGVRTRRVGQWRRRIGEAGIVAPHRSNRHAVERAQGVALRTGDSWRTPRPLPFARSSARIMDTPGRRLDAGLPDPRQDNCSTSQHQIVWS